MAKNIFKDTPESFQKFFGVDSPELIENQIQYPTTPDEVKEVEEELKAHPIKLPRDLEDAKKVFGEYMPKYIIKSKICRGTYYSHWSGIGPCFGATKDAAFRFDTEEEAKQIMSSHLTGFVGCSIEKYSPKIEKG